MAALCLGACDFVEQQVPATWRMMHEVGAQREPAGRYRKDEARPPRPAADTENYLKV